MNAVELLLSDARGVYIPRDFVEDFDVTRWGLDPDSWAIKTCADPEDLNYWDAWNDILGRSEFKQYEGHNVWRLHQDGDLWAICYELMTDEEKTNFGMED